MSLNEIMNLIESLGFSSKLNLASSRNLFFQILEEDKVVLDFVDFIKKNSDQIIEVLSRLELLTRLKVNPRYENPNDIAISIYCWVLYKVSPQIGKIAATMATSATGTWWANEVAVFVLEDSFTTQKNANSILNEFNLEKKPLKFSPKNRKNSIGENLPIPTLLFKDIAKYKINNDFKRTSSSYLSELKSYDWKDFVESFSLNFKSSSKVKNDILLTENWI